MENVLCNLHEFLHEQMEEARSIDWPRIGKTVAGVYIVAVFVVTAWYLCDCCCGVRHHVAPVQQAYNQEDTP